MAPVSLFPGGSEERLKQYHEELDSQTDRGVAVLAASFLEWRVKQAIQATMSVWDDNAELVFGSDDRPGKLGFVDSCRVSYSLGLLGPIGLADAQRVAKIRNSFAHHFEITSFSEPSINDRCKALESPERFMKVIGSGDSNIATPRPRYIWTVLALDAMLYYAASVYSPKWPKRPIGTEPYW